jgi:hypothetical protein
MSELVYKTGTNYKYIATVDKDWFNITKIYEFPNSTDNIHAAITFRKDDLPFLKHVLLLIESKEQNNDESK